MKQIAIIKYLNPKGSDVYDIKEISFEDLQKSDTYDLMTWCATKDEAKKVLSVLNEQNGTGGAKRRELGPIPPDMEMQKDQSLKPVDSKEADKMLRIKEVVNSGVVRNIECSVKVSKFKVAAALALSEDKVEIEAAEYGMGEESYRFEEEAPCKFIRFEDLTEDEQTFSEGVGLFFRYDGDVYNLDSFTKIDPESEPGLKDWFGVYPLTGYNGVVIKDVDIESGCTATKYYELENAITASPNFDTWLDTLISEKAIDPEQRFNIEDTEGTNHSMPYGVVLEAIKSTSAEEQEAIKRTLVMLDFKNGDIRHYLRHLAGALVNS
jgi:hypothetical protein